jgi:hypothetical protein
MAQLGVQRFDPYPFAFMSFLSTLAQLIFMIVIMVGQDVLNKAADRRSEQTLLDAEAILHECRRMKARLVAQDRVIDSLADYTSTQVTRQLARAIHESRLDAAVADGREPGSRPALRPWDELPEGPKESYRVEARQLGERLAEIGCLMVPTYDPELTITFDEAEAQLLARLEYEHRSNGQQTLPVAQLPGQRDALDDSLVPWEQLPEQARAQAVAAARRIPAVLASVGFQVLRTGAGAEGAGELDFTPEEWETLGTSLMAAGVLVALAEGVADPEELSALVKALREASVGHPRRFIRELTGSSTFATGLRPDTTYVEYRGPALETIREATGIVARTAPEELAGFRAFMMEIAAIVADANDEGGFFGLGARPRVPNEAAAMEAVRTAMLLDRQLSEPGPGRRSRRA